MLAKERNVSFANEVGYHGRQAFMHALLGY